MTGSAPRRWVDWGFRSRQTGKLTIAQMPNKILASFFALRAAQALLSPPAPAADLLRWAGSATLAWWALDEVLRGVNPFRRVLGAAALTWLVLA